MGPTVTGPVLDPLAVSLLNNRLYILLNTQESAALSTFTWVWSMNEMSMEEVGHFCCFFCQSSDAVRENQERNYFLWQVACFSVSQKSFLVKERKKERQKERKRSWMKERKKIN